jgi:hypothetical protein
VNNDGYRDEINAWLAVRKEAALQIDEATAEVDWWDVRELDPYGVDPDLAEKSREFVPAYFACAPGGDIWVNFDDLPDEVRDALCQRVQNLMEQNLMRRSSGAVVEVEDNEDTRKIVMQFNDPEVKGYLAVRKRAALRIDPATAEVYCWYARTVDPYGVISDMPEMYSQIGREYFVRASGSDICVSAGDIPGRRGWC